MMMLLWIACVGCVAVTATSPEVCNNKKCISEKLSNLSLMQLLELQSKILSLSSSTSTSTSTTTRRSLLSTTADPASDIVTVRSHASNYHMTVVGSADIDKEQPLYQPALEGYYPAFGYNSATPQCRRLLNRYLGKCMMGGNKPTSGGSARFRETNRLQANQRADNSLLHQRSLEPLSEAVNDESEGEAATTDVLPTRGEDQEFSEDLGFAANIINEGVVV